MIATTAALSGTVTSHSRRANHKSRAVFPPVIYGTVMIYSNCSANPNDLLLFKYIHSKTFQAHWIWKMSITVLCRPQCSLFKTHNADSSETHIQRTMPSLKHWCFHQDCCWCHQLWQMQPVLHRSGWITANTNGNLLKLRQTEKILKRFLPRFCIPNNSSYTTTQMLKRQRIISLSKALLVHGRRIINFQLKPKF